MRPLLQDWKRNVLFNVQKPTERDKRSEKRNMFQTKDQNKPQKDGPF